MNGLSTVTTRTTRRILTSNLRLFQELEEFLSRFHGETPILLKGSGLVFSGCRDMRERPMEDADILLRPRDIPAAVAVLESMGFTKMPGLLSSYRKELLDIDLHTDVWYLEKSEEDAFRARAREVEVGDSRALVPHPQDHLLYIMAHAAVHHGILEPKWLEDARALARFSAAEIDGSVLAARAEALGLKPAVSWFLGHAGLDVPEMRVQRSVSSGWTRLLEADFPYRGQLLTLVFLRGWLFRLRYAARTLFPDNAFMSRRYDLDKPGRFVFWRAARPLQLIAGFLLSLVSLCAGFLRGRLGLRPDKV